MTGPTSVARSAVSPTTNSLAACTQQQAPGPSDTISVPERVALPMCPAALIARIYEVFPLLCPNCGGQMRIIAFITFSADIQKILEHIGVEPEAPHITPARGPPLLG